MPVKEAEATNSLIDQGVDVLTCHVDGPKTMVENAARRGAMVCGYHANQSPLAPKAYLTGAEWNWEALYPKFVKMIAGRRSDPELLSRRPEGRDRQVLALWRRRSRPKRASTPTTSRPSSCAGDYAIFKGPIADNKGKTVIAAGTERGQKDPELEKMDYLVEGVIGATS